MLYAEEKYRDQGFKLWPHGNADEGARYRAAMLVYGEHTGHFFTIYASKGQDWSKLPDLVRSLQKVEAWLEKNTQTPFFMNTPEPTLVDIDALPMFLRYRAVKGTSLQRIDDELHFEQNFPRLNQFIDAMLAIDQFRDTLPNFATSGHFMNQAMAHQDGKLQLYLPVEYKE